MLEHSLNKSWVYYTSQNKNPYYNGYLFAQNQTRLQGNNTGNTLYGIGMAQNQPPLHYPAMLKPYSIYQNPVPSTSNLLQIEPDRDNTSPSSSELSNWSDDWKKHSSWSLNEERYLIAAYKGYYDRLKSTKSSQGKKTILEDVLKQFQSMCFDNGVESQKSLVQFKEKWLALLDKYKSVCDNNNRMGREWKTFKHYEDIDEFMVSSDKVNPRFVKETKAHKQDCGKKPEKRPATSAEGDSEDAEISIY